MGHLVGTGLCRKPDVHSRDGKVWRYFERTQLCASVLKHFFELLRRRLDALKGFTPEMLRNTGVLENCADECVGKLGWIASMSNDVVLNALRYPGVALAEGNRSNVKILAHSPLPQAFAGNFLVQSTRLTGLELLALLASY
jgi:hypothetical protein